MGYEAVRTRGATPGRGEDRMGSTAARFVHRPESRRWTAPPTPGDATAFHRSLSGYAPTPLRELPTVADELGVARVVVKDESSRLGLPAFKVLGASWACHRVLGDGRASELVTATDGNHGRAVAAVARRSGVAATVFVPAVTTSATVARIAGEGATVERVDGSYDEAVERAAAYAAEAPARRALVQDTAWPGYEEVPRWIVEGYATLLREVDEQLGGPPDLVAVPNGVGSLAEAVVRHHRQPDAPHPVVLAVEPTTAACLLESLAADRRTSVATGDTVMAGLNCGTVSLTAWPVLRAGCDAVVAVDDEDAQRAVRDLAITGVSCGPSGAAALAGVRAVLGDPGRRAALELEADATAVLLGTEADQDDVAAAAT